MRLIFVLLAAGIAGLLQQDAHAQPYGGSFQSSSSSSGHRVSGHKVAVLQGVSSQSASGSTSAGGSDSSQDGDDSAAGNSQQLLGGSSQEQQAAVSSGGKRSGASVKIIKSASSSSRSSGGGSRQQSGSKSSSGSSNGVAVIQTQAGGGPVQTGVVYPEIVEGGVAPPQVPGVWEALDVLRGKPAIPVEEIQALLVAAQPGVDYPAVLAEIPDQISFNCANVKQAGYYADPDFKCQVYRRCDIDGQETSYLCPERTLFNQITLICDWFYNVKCENSLQFYDYSNARLYHSDWLLFDTPPEADWSAVDAGQVGAIQAANAGRGPQRQGTGQQYSGAKGAGVKVSGKAQRAGRVVNQDSDNAASGDDQPAPASPQLLSGYAGAPPPLVIKKKPVAVGGSAYGPGPAAAGSDQSSHDDAVSDDSGDDASPAKAAPAPVRNYKAPKPAPKPPAKVAGPPAAAYSSGSAASPSSDDSAQDDTNDAPAPAAPASAPVSNYQAPKPVPRPAPKPVAVVAAGSASSSGDSSHDKASDGADDSAPAPAPVSGYKAPQPAPKPAPKPKLVAAAQAYAAPAPVAAASSDDQGDSDDSSAGDDAPAAPAPISGGKPQSGPVLVAGPKPAGGPAYGAASSHSASSKDDQDSDDGVAAVGSGAKTQLLSSSSSGSKPFRGAAVQAGAGKKSSSSSSNSRQSGARSIGAKSGSSSSGGPAIDVVQTQAGGGPVQTGVVYPEIVEGGVAPPQVPGVWEALDVLRGKPAIPVEEIQVLLAAAQPDVDYPILSEIPDQISFNCANVKQAGYYADPDFRCQVFRRCDIDGQETSYLCPNQTLFNQITLVCDWFYNIICANSVQFYDYSNARLYHSDWLLFDTPPEADLSGVDAAQVGAIQAANAGRGKKKPAKGGRRPSGNGGNGGGGRGGREKAGQRELLSASSQQVPY